MSTVNSKQKLRLLMLVLVLTSGSIMELPTYWQCDDTDVDISQVGQCFPFRQL